MKPIIMQASDCTLCSEIRRITQIDPRPYVGMFYTKRTRVDPIIQKVIKLQLHIMASKKSCSHKISIYGKFFVKELSFMAKL